MKVSSTFIKDPHSFSTIISAFSAENKSYKIFRFKLNRIFQINLFFWFSIIKLCKDCRELYCFVVTL